MKPRDNTPHRPHPALLLFLFANGTAVTIVGAVLFYVGAHPGAGSRHGQPEAFVLGVLLLLLGMGLLAKGILMVRRRAA